MYRVHIHLTTGEKLRSFKARQFDVELDKQSEAALQKFTYLGPDNEEENIYLNPKGVAAIELRPTSENTKSKEESTEHERAGSWQNQDSQEFQRKISPSSRKARWDKPEGRSGRPPQNPEPGAHGPSLD